MVTDPNAVGEWIVTGRNAVELARAALKLMPSGPNKQEVERKLSEAEAALARSNAEVAKRLGYDLCRCQFPPAIMLEKRAESVRYCPSCGHTESTELPSSPGEPYWDERI